MILGIKRSADEAFAAQPFGKSDLPSFRDKFAQCRERIVDFIKQNKKEYFYVKRSVLAEKITRPVLITEDNQCFVIAKKHVPLSQEPIDRRLGKGMQKSVWVAYNLDSEEEMAVLTPRNPQESKGLQVEFQFLRLISKNVDLFSYEGKNFRKSIIIQKKYKSDLRTIKLSSSILEKKIEMMKQLTKQLIKLKENLIIHNDIKPSNILIDSEENPQLSDFGLAKKSQKSCKLQGTPIYVSPEAFNGTFSCAKDMWAMGLVFSEMAWNYDWENHIIGEIEEASLGVLQVKLKQFQDDWHENFLPRNKFSSGNRRLDDLIRRTLAPDPAKRITPEALLEGLTDL